MTRGTKAQKFAQSYINKVNSIRAIKLSQEEQTNIINWFNGLQSLGLIDLLLEGWTLRSIQNIGTGTTLIGFKGDFNGTLVNGPVWDTMGLSFNSASSQFVNVSPWGQLTGRVDRTLLSVIQQPLTSSSPSISYGSLTQGGLAELMHQEGYMGFADFTTLGNVPDATGLPSLISPKMCAGVYTQGSPDVVSFFRNYSSFSQNLSSNENTGSSELNIGKRFGGGSYFGGIISFVAVFSVAISQSTFIQIYALYKSTIGKGLGLP